MKKRGVQLGDRHQAWVHATWSLLFATGAGWLVVRRWFAHEGEFGLEPSAWEPWLLKAHGAGALVFCIVLGSLIPAHIRIGWRMRRNRASGAVFLALNGLLVVSGYLLYYAGGETTRAVVSAGHWGLGLAFPALIAWHIAAGRRSA